MPWRPSDKPKKGQAAIPASRIVRLRRKPSVYPWDWCEADGCGSYKDVFYDRELRKHLCGECWSSTPRPDGKPGSVSSDDVEPEAPDYD